MLARPAVRPDRRPDAPDDGAFTQTVPRPRVRSAAMTPVTAAITDDLAPTGTLRASINLGNPVLAHGTP
ncbi:hypothetical protein GCM10009657_39030 [Oryzihumus leptocrescens]